MVYTIKQSFSDIIFQMQRPPRRGPRSEGAGGGFYREGVSTGREGGREGGRWGGKS